MASSATDSQHADRDIRQKLVETGDVDVILSVGNNFFYTLSLPCTLWFFDKGKKDELKDKVLFIDARNYFSVVDRNLNEWTKWQIKNLSCIVHLYRGETDKYKAVLEDYFDAIRAGALFIDDLEKRDLLTECNSIEHLHEILTITQEQIKICEETAQKAEAQAERKSKKAIKQANEDMISNIKENEEIIKQALWLSEKFGDGNYADVAGLCKIATKAEISEKNYSLTPGAYVGVAEVQDDDENFEDRMKEIHKELNTLQNESNDLMATINANLKELGLEA